MKLYPLALVILLAGCELMPTKPTQPEPIIVEKVKYEIKLPPADLLKLPKSVPTLDLTNPALKQSDVSRWIELNEERTLLLENNLIGIGNFFNDEQKKLNEGKK